MALVSKNLEATLRYVDDNGKIGTFNSYLPAATLLADARTKIETLQPLATALSLCSFAGYSVSQVTVEDTYPATGPAGSQVEDKAVFDLRTADGNTSRVVIPGINDAILQADNLNIDQADADVAALIAEILGGTVTFVGVGGSDLAAVTAAYKQQRRSQFNKRNRRG
jgi:hypothetical protein